MYIFRKKSIKEILLGIGDNLDKEIQNKLTNLLVYCKENISFYTYLFRNINFYDGIKFEEIFTKIPVISKSYLKNNWKMFVSKEYDLSKLEQIFNIDKDFNKEYTYNIDGTKVIAECTSGNTGVPFIIAKTYAERLKLGKIIWKKRREFSSEVRPENIINFVHQFGDNRYPFPFEYISDNRERINKEIVYLKDSNILMWHISGYKLNEYASFLSDENINFPKLRFIENNGSYLSYADKLKYEKKFNSKIVNNYGCREVWNIAYSCHYDHLHVNNDSVYLEILDDNGNVITQNDKIGHIVVTSFNLRFFPFIRYQVGDMGKYVETKCDQEGRAIEIFPGRDYIYGTKVYGNKIFKSVIISIITDYNIKNFDSISIKQVSENNFLINIKNNQELKHELENAFKKTADIIMSNNGIYQKFEYFFTYDNDLRVKSIFTCCI